MPGEYVAVRSAGTKLKNCIFLSWEDAALQLADNELRSAKYKVFSTWQEAEKYIQSGEETKNRKRKAPSSASLPLSLKAAEKKEDDDHDASEKEADGSGNLVEKNSNSLNSKSASNAATVAVGAETSASAAAAANKSAPAAPRVSYKASANPPTKAWEIGFEELAATATNGKLPEVQMDPKIKRWIARQNQEYKKLMNQEPSSMTQEKIQRLRSIGYELSKRVTKENNMDWDSEFEVMFEKLGAFRKEHGHCRVTINHKEHKDLFQWVVKVRNEYKKLDKKAKCRLSTKQMKRLTDVNFFFRQKGKYKSWEDRMEELVAYKNSGGNINKISLNHDLGEFVGRMRKEYRLFIDGEKTAMTQERITALEAVGFDWNVRLHRDKSALPKPKTWDERFAELFEFYEEYGDTLVPKDMEGGLGQWVKSQRHQMKQFSAGKKSSLTGEKVARLASIGFVVDVNEHRKRIKVEDQRTRDYEEVAAGYERYQPQRQEANGYIAQYRI